MSINLIFDEHTLSVFSASKQSCPASTVWPSVGDWRRQMLLVEQNVVPNCLVLYLESHDHCRSGNSRSHQKLIWLLPYFFLEPFISSIYALLTCDCIISLIISVLFNFVHATAQRKYVFFSLKTENSNQRMQYYSCDNETLLCIRLHNDRRETKTPLLGRSSMGHIPAHLYGVLCLLQEWLASQKQHNAWTINCYEINYDNKDPENIQSL